MNYQQLWRLLAKEYGEGEAKAMARMVYEVGYGLTMADVLAGRDAGVADVERVARRLMAHEPVQYVLGCADFCGRQFKVDASVLIPRPETEELCRWIVAEWGGASCRVLDVGTGSGCIAVTLAKEMTGARVEAWDISEKALAVARQNARLLKADVTFRQQDALRLADEATAVYDVIVSNPPYICRKERASMEANVLEYEPESALFVPDDDPLLFYRAIARYGLSALRSGGCLYFELNPLYAEALGQMLRSMAWSDVELRTDEYGKQRMIRARR